MTANQGVVYVVAKAPLPGTSKTRLCPPLEPDQAARLSAAFLLDTLETVRRASLEARVVCRDAGEQDILERLVGRSAAVHVQLGAGLGAALETAFALGLREGFPAVAVLGADSPTLPAAILRQAFDALDHGADVALGPSDDGGYYLLAARALHRRLFRGMAWSTATVAQTTLDRCQEAGLAPRVLPTWYDVDDAASLARLWHDLRWQPASPLASRTRSVLSALGTVSAAVEAGQPHLVGAG